MTYRNLNDSEIAQLRSQGCRAEDWSKVRVSEPFLADRIERVCFSGEVHIGSLEGDALYAGGARRPNGIYASGIHQCTIGNGVRIASVGNLANYAIDDGVVVDNVGVLAVEGESRFGNGIELDILNEAGGRPLKIFDRLSSQIAYLLVLYRHDAAMIERLEALVDRYVEGKKASVGRLGAGCRIENTSAILNVCIGPHARVCGATQLREGTIGSCAEAPALVGSGVVAKGFIILSGSKVEDGAVIGNCFIGQGVQIGKQYSAENSAFFANCEGFHGEACSIFAGPYTVTHHKSTLLIAGLFSFYNAGSGTNQSNHMYKLGPLHQGVLMRGAKTGSFSYLLWPSQVGPFSVVVGKHMNNFDAGDLPFSYITAVDEQAVVTPAMNLFTVGTRRDSAKWPARDRRKDPERLDLIHFDLFSPYIVGKSLRAIDALRALYAEASKDKEYVLYKGARIARLMLRTSCKYYEMIVKIFLGECLLVLLDEAGGSATRVRERLAALSSGAGAGNWVDISGLLAPAERIDALLAEIASGAFADIDAVQARMAQIHGAYGEEKQRWFTALLAERMDIVPADFTNDRMAAMLEDWRTTTLKLNNMVLQDAQKEFDATSQIGCGIDGDKVVRERDFLAVRGTFEDNKFVKEVRADSESAVARADSALAKLEQET